MARSVRTTILRADFFHRDGNGFFAVIENLHHILGDGFGETSFLPFGFSRPKFYDDVRHRFLLSEF
jgi:hypothetical protein